MTDLSTLAKSARAWPFEEARKLLVRTKGQVPEKGYVLFQTGYGPSGLPHMGTFGEVARTTMVRKAFEALCPDIPTKLVCFSDDLDGLRKVPDNVPNKEALAKDLGKPLTKVMDPFGTHASFGEHNNARLCAFLDRFNFEYDFVSATDYYTSGRFDEALMRVLETYDDIMGIMLPTLGDERRATYSPFLPICPKTGIVLQVPVVERNLSQGTIVYQEADGTKTEVSVKGGACKLQWKPDWGMRKYALGVDYEMAGKDLIDSTKLSAKIVKVLGARAPEGFDYELFLDLQGQKISKSKGNGLTMEEWLTYAPDESLSLYMFTKPRTAKRLYFDVIPKAVDDYLTFIGKFPEEDEAKQLENPVWHIHNGNPPAPEIGLSFAILLNLASVVNADDPSILWGFISRYQPDATPENAPMLGRLVGYAMTYYQDFVKPNKSYRAPTDAEQKALQMLHDALDEFKGSNDAQAIQSAVFAVGKAAEYENLREWFQALYQVLLGQDQGPRFGSFIALYGVEETQALITKALAGQSLA